MKTTLQNVSPALAAEWLTTDETLRQQVNGKVVHRQRTVSARKVAQYATDMANGNWETTHQGIAIDSEGFILDGRNRLHAVVHSRKTVPFQVTTNIPSDKSSDFMRCIDIGKPRDASTQLWIAHGIHNAK